MMMKKILLIAAILGLILTDVGCKKDIITGVASPILSVADVRALHTGADVTLNAENLMGASSVAGIVISDPANGNYPKGVLILQSLRRKKVTGIALNIGDAAAQYKPGDSVVAKIVGGVLNRSNGFLQVSGIAAADVSKISANNPQKVTLVATTFTSLTNNIDTYESTLVQLKSAVVDAPVIGQTYKGDIQISDFANPIILHTETTASFASSIMPDLGDYTGIPLNYTDKKPTLWLRNLADVVGQQLEPHIPRANYANFPEGWEKAIIGKTSNADGVAILPTGEWQMNGMYIINSANIKSKTGTWCVMMQKGKDCSLQMNFNLPYGASKFSFNYGSAVPTSDGKSTLRVEYSQDSGNTWTVLGDDLQITDVNTYYFKEYTLDIKGPVRFRIHKPITGTGVVDLGRVAVDNVAIYQN